MDNSELVTKSNEFMAGAEYGYCKAMRDICAGLRTRRTSGGEAITGAVHAADVIERGDFMGFASKPPTPTEGNK